MAENKHVERKTAEAGFITKASAKYCDKFPLRAAIQAIPSLGSSLDTMLAGLGAKYQYERLEDFILKLDEKIKQVEQSGRLTNVEPSVPLFDLMIQVFDQVIRTRSEEKRKRFANLVTNQVIRQANWDEAETACRLLGDLSDIHIQVLDASLKAKPTDIDNLRVITISRESLRRRRRYREPMHLQHIFPSLSESVIRMICSELISRGLLYDEGIGRIETKAMEYFVATDLAKWLMDWISEQAEKSVS